MRSWQRVQSILDVRSGVVMTVLFVYMLGLIAYCHVTGKPLQSEAVIFALGVLGLKTTHTIMTKKDDING